MRDQKKQDSEIIEFLGLKEKVPFKMDRKYLRELYGFVTERLSKDFTGMYNRWKVYHKQKIEGRLKE